MIGSDIAPKVILNKQTGEFLFEGVSMSEDIRIVYMPIADWLQKYSLNPNPKTVVKFKLIYFNTTSSNMFLNILHQFNEMYKKGHNVIIEWYHLEGDDGIEDAGIAYSSRFTVPFKKIMVSSFE